MPIEIRELHIKATVQDQDSNGNPQSAQDAGKNPGDVDKIVALCVEKILEILRDQTER